MKNLFTLLYLLPLSLCAQTWKQTNQTLLQQADAFAQQKAWDNYATNGVAITNNLFDNGQYEATIQTAETFIKTLATNQPKPSTILAQLYKNIGKGYYVLNDFNQALPALMQTLQIREAINPKDSNLVKDYYNVGQTNRILGRNQAAVIFLNKALATPNANELLADIYSELLLVYTKLGNYEKAQQYSTMALFAAEQQYSRTSLEYALAVFGQGYLAAEANDHANAIGLYQKALRLIQALPYDDAVNKLNILNNLAESYHRSQLFDSAALTFQQTVISAQIANHKNLTREAYLGLGAAYAKLNKPAEAKTAFDKGFVLVQNNPKSITYANYQLNYGSLYLLNYNDPAAALAYFQKQLVALLEDFNNTDVNVLPTEKDFDKCISLEGLTNALGWKARAWLALYNTNKQAKDLQKALQTIQLYDNTINYIRRNNSENSNIEWSEIALDAYENAINICLALYQSSNDAQYQQQAFYFAEKSKSLALLEAFQTSKAKSFAGIPTEILEQEAQLKLDITQLEQDLFQLSAKKNKNNLGTLIQLQEQVASKKAAYEELLAELKNKYPQYHQTKYDIHLLNATEARKLLAPEQAIVEYFVGKDDIFIFKITADSFDIKRLATHSDTLLNRVIQLRGTIYDYFLGNVEQTPANYKQLAINYIAYAHELYKLLIEPILPLPKRLIIVPDGGLSYLPFDALLSELPTQPTAFKTHPYILRKYSISYCYSATLLQEMQSKQHNPSNTFLAFAPQFGDGYQAEVRGKRYNLAPLMHNVPEVQRAQAVLKTGKVLTGAEATEAHFKKIGGNYRIVHFATHGMANNEFPDYSLLAFTEIKDTIENEYLYVNDLYNIELNADLVVLSACETGIGKLQRGEGIMSLARGFSYAGAKSIFTTLWSVNDQATAIIVENFYKYIAEGKPKDEALQLARLDFINQSADNTAHPFLWSPYILIGDAAPIGGLGSYSLWLIFGGGALVVVALGGLLTWRLQKLKD